MKATNASQVQKLTDIPNVGPRVAHDFNCIGIQHPKELRGKNPYTLYTKLCAVTKTRHDPCLLDTFMAAVDFMNGAPMRPWWYYTKARKKEYPKI